VASKQQQEARGDLHPFDFKTPTEVSSIVFLRLGNAQRAVKTFTFPSKGKHSCSNVDMLWPRFSEVHPNI
jgi:hypothetical protein